MTLIIVDIEINKICLVYLFLTPEAVISPVHTMVSYSCSYVRSLQVME